MVEKLPSLPSELSERPRYAAQVTEDLLTGGRRLRQALLQTPMRFAGRDMPLIRPSDPEPSVILMRSGLAFRFCGLADGRRAILNVVAPGDFIGLDHIVLHRPIEEITAANRVGYHQLRASEVRALMADPAVTLQILALMAEGRWRGDRLAARFGRLVARGRTLLRPPVPYDRPSPPWPVSRMTFNL